MECREEDTDTWEEEDTDIWEEAISIGRRMHSITRTRDGVREDTIKCLSGKTNMIAIFPQYNSMEDVTSVMVLEQWIEEECPFLAEIATEKEVSVPNASEEEEIISMEDLVENAREAIGKEEVDTEAQVVVALVMITNGEVNNMEDLEDLSSNKEVQVMVVKVVLEVVMEVLQEVIGDDDLDIRIPNNKI